jgi:hypothetical protein
VLPDDGAVIAVTGSLPDMQKPLDILWAHREALFGDGPLPDDQTAQHALADAIAALEVPSPDAAAAFPAEFDGVRYLLDDAPFDAVSVEAEPDGAALILTQNGLDHRFRIGADRWAEGLTDLAPEAATPVFARGGWVDATTFRARIVGADDPHGFDHELRFDGDTVVWTSRELVSFDPIVTQRAVGRREQEPAA